MSNNTREGEPINTFTVELSTRKEQLAVFWAIDTSLRNGTHIEVRTAQIGMQQPKDLKEDNDTLRKIYINLGRNLYGSDWSLTPTEKVSLGLIDILSESELRDVMSDETMGSTGGDLQKFANYLLKVKESSK